MLKGKFSSRRRVTEEVDAMSGLANLSDVMLVFACGLMAAVILNWNVDLSKTRVEILQRVADKAAVQVFAGDDIRRSRGHLRVKVGRDAVHEPGEAVGARTTAGQGKNKRNGQHHCGKADQGMFQENALLVK